MGVTYDKRQRQLEAAGWQLVTYSACGVTYQGHVKQAEASGLLTVCNAWYADAMGSANAPDAIAKALAYLTPGLQPDAYRHGLLVEAGAGNDWDYRYTETEENPFGRAGVDYSGDAEYKCEPLWLGAKHVTPT